MGSNGISVIHASQEEWQPDPELPGSDAAELIRADGVWAGFTRYTTVDGPVTWTPERREVAFILEGSARIELAGQTIDVSRDDLFTLPPGVETTWHITAPFKEIWFLAD
jgi:uncharacterized cupin superfamily protein